MPTAPAFTGRWAFLSNFYTSRLQYKGRWYPTSEHAYQAAKMTNQIHHDWVTACTTPGQAKRRARSLPMRPGWDQARDAVMLDILRIKFSEPGLAKLLLDTGEQDLIEFNYWHDTYWGVCDGVGQNKLGKLLMQVRDELKTKQEK